jgi:GAF domain-containing protein
MYSLHKILVKYLEANQTLAEHNLSEDEIQEVAEYLGKYCISLQLDEIIRMVEDVLGIDPKLEWKEILAVAARKIVEFLNAAAASIRIFDPETDKLVAFGAYQYAEINRLKSIPVEKTVAGKVIRTGKSYLVPNILAEPDYKNKDIVKEYGFNSLMAVPINIPGFHKDEPDVKGAIQIYYRENERDFDPLEVTSAELLSRRISHVLARKRILDLQKLNTQKEKIVEKIFVKLSHREGIKMKDVFRMMMPELVDIIQIQSCSLFSISPDKKHVQIELEYPVGHESHDSTCQFTIEDHPYFNVLIHGSEKMGDYEYERIDPSYVFIKEPLKSSLSNDEMKRYAVKNNVNSVLLIPLKAQDEINYFLVFYATDRRQEFTDREIELLNFFGKEIMKALRIEKLDDVLHDFKNPSIAIAGFARRAKKFIENENLEEVKGKIAEYIDIIYQETMRMQELVIYPSIEGRERIVDLTEVLKSRFKINEEAISEQKRKNISLVQVELQPGLFICCYPFALERVLDNLLDNATKAIPEEGGVLSITSYQRGEMACVEICNTGRISEDKVEEIRKGDVKGRGLNIIYRFIQGLGGRLEVSTDRDSTTFRMIIPLCDRE